MQQLKYRHRLYPTPNEHAELRRIVGCVRFVWNHFLAREIDTYKQTGHFNFYNTNSADLTKLKQQPATDFLNLVPSTALQQTLRDLDRSLRTFLKKRNTRKPVGFPKFKKKRNQDGSFTLAMVNASRNIDGDLFHIKKGLDVKFIQHRPLPSDFKTCQIKQDGDIWFVVLTVEKAPIKSPATGKTVGIDLNSKDFVLSDGTRFPIPKYLKEAQHQIKKLQRKLAKAKKGSKNRDKIRAQLYKVHQSVRNKRLDYFHKLSRRLVNDYDFIVLEDLDVKSMQQTRSHVIKDNGFAMFRAMIEYKCKLYGKQVFVIDRYYPSSQLCSNCGELHKMPDDENRLYECPDCGLIMDRDLNAAINIERAGTAPDNACGDDSLMKQMVTNAIMSGINDAGSYVL